MTKWQKEADEKASKEKESWDQLQKFNEKNGKQKCKNDHEMDCVNSIFNGQVQAIPCNECREVFQVKTGCLVCIDCQYALCSKCAQEDPEAKKERKKKEEEAKKLEAEKKAGYVEEYKKNYEKGEGIKCKKGHLLKYTEEGPGFGCDYSETYKTCIGGGSRKMGVWYCEECDFDCCYECFKTESGLQEKVLIEKEKEEEDSNPTENYNHLEIEFISGDSDEKTY